MSGPPHESPGADPARITTIAARLLDAHDRHDLIADFGTIAADLDIAAAYEVAHHIETARRAQGWQPVGRKIGFTNRAIWPLFGLSEPMWAWVWDRTLISATDATAPVEIDVDQFVQPRLEPEVVFKLAASPQPGSNAVEVLSCVEWFAAGFEIVQCLFPEWRFNAAECIAAFGLHGALIIGPPTAVEGHGLAELADALATFTATLSRNGAVVEQGNGSNVLDSPALAIAQLANVLAHQAQFGPLVAGELITTGTLTNPQVIHAGDAWTSDYGALDIAGLTVTFA